MNTTKDKILLLAGCGMAAYEIADHLDLKITYVRQTINTAKRKIREREARKASEAVESAEMR